jgi:hypothetical protein
MLSGCWHRKLSCPLWVISSHLRCNTPCLLYSRKRTLAVQNGMSAMDHKPTSNGINCTPMLNGRQKMILLQRSALAHVFDITLQAIRATKASANQTGTEASNVAFPFERPPAHDIINIS